MSRVWFAINVFNEAALISDCINSIKSYCPDSKIVAVDGAYASFIASAKIAAAEEMSLGNDVFGDQILRMASGPSNDDTIEKLGQLGVDFIIKCPSKGGWKDEIVKRSEYFKVGEAGDLFFVIDADEQIIFQKQVSAEEMIKMAVFPHYVINLRRDDDISPYPVFRIHRWSEGICYKGFHNGIHVNGQLVKKQDYEKPETTWPGAYLYHRWHYRGKLSPARHAAKGSYYRYLLQDEKAFRDANGV